MIFDGHPLCMAPINILTMSASISLWEGKKLRSHHETRIEKKRNKLLLCHTLFFKKDEYRVGACKRM